MRFLLVFLRRNVYLILASAMLLVASSIINYFLVSDLSIKWVRNSVQGYLQSREKEVDQLASNADLVNRLSERRYSLSELTDLSQKPYGIFVFQPQARGGGFQLRFWSDQQAEVPDSLLARADGRYFVTLTNGQYEVVRKTLSASTGQVMIALIPIRWQYFISSPSLKPGFVNDPEAESRVRISATPTIFPVRNLSGNVLFYLEKIESYRAARHSWGLLLLGLSGILLMLIVFHNLARALSDQFGKWVGVGFLIFFLLSLRGLLYSFPSLLHLRQYELFDPTIYSSNFILSSLGDLLIDALLSCWVILFIRNLGMDTMPFIPRRTAFRPVVAVFALLAMVLTAFVFANIVQSLVADARISFNVTRFFSMNVYSYVGFIVLAALALGFFFLSQILLRWIEALVPGNSLLIYLTLSVGGLMLLTFYHKPRVVQLDILVLAWLLAYVWLMLRNLFSGLKDRLNVSEVLFWLFVFSISISTVIIYENHQIELGQRKKWAEKISQEKDPTNKKLISLSLISLDNDVLAQKFERFRSPISSKIIKDSLIYKNFTASTHTFDTKIFTYDSLEKPLFNDEPVSFDTLNTIYEGQGKPVDVPDLKYYEKSFDKFIYIYKKKIVSPHQRTLGYLFLLAEPKKEIGSTSLAPEITQMRKEYEPEYLPSYFYAIYSKQKLIYHYNNYPFSTLLRDDQVPGQDVVQRRNGSYDELWQRIGSDMLVVIVKKDNSLIEAITMFAYLFSAFLVLVILFYLVSVLIQTRLHWRQILQFLQFNIRSQIHATIIFVSLFSFVVIGVATIYFFINRYERNTQDQIRRSIEIMVNEIQVKYPDLANSEDPGSLERLIPRSELEDLISSLDRIHGTNVNLYNLEGDLMVSSNPFLYNKGVLSRKMHPVAFYQMSVLRSVEFLNNEQIGQSSFQSMYWPIRVGNGNACAFLNIPSISNPDELKDEISKFLVTVINLNVFIFLIAGTIALFLTNRIVSSFSLISEKMRDINLGKTNETVEWKRDDEIGGLVKEYNKMVSKLEESAVALAKTEREFAWREMARQVAHEIKNPLTPMKLSIQYLQKAIDNNSANVKELTANVAKTLVEQIDHLSKIAADFSQFANIGNPKNEVFDLHDMLYSLTSLYETTENLLFKWVPVHERIMVFADKTQLNRLFTNLLQNALEACTGKERRVVSVSEELKGDTILVKVTDNGEGVPDAMKNKIFMPNFTTKSSGTGLGLAMSKTIVEQAKGKIWFETQVGEGTTFFVELPVLRATATQPHP